jgi:catechol 2,3-dioxygenase-like lactoylglutathione lyase family enzyme
VSRAVSPHPRSLVAERFRGHNLAVPSEYIRPYGSTNVSLSSANPRRSAEFYASVLDDHAVDCDGDFVQIQTPGAEDVTIFQGTAKAIGRLSALAHFGFRSPTPQRVAAAAAAVKAAGGEVIEEGELVAGEPYLFARDLDGYLFEIWYESRH